jgi:5'-AMP-activated protein kinase, regulatory gamma subunit
MLDCHTRQITLVSEDSQSGRSWAVSVLSQYRILKFVPDNVGETQLLRKPLKDINLGTRQSARRVYGYTGY